MAERQIDLKTAVVLVSVGMTVAGGGGTILGTSVNTALVSRIDKAEIAIIDAQNKISDHERRLREIEREFLKTSTEIQADLNYIKNVVRKLDNR